MPRLPQEQEIRETEYVQFWGAVMESSYLFRASQLPFFSVHTGPTNCFLTPSFHTHMGSHQHGTNLLSTKPICTSKKLELFVPGQKGRGIGEQALQGRDQDWSDNCPNYMMMGIYNSKFPVGWGLLAELYWQEALWMLMISPRRGNPMDVLHAVFVNIKSNIYFSQWEPQMVCKRTLNYIENNPG